MADVQAGAVRPETEAKWGNFVRGNLRTGADPAVLRKYLLEQQVPVSEARALMGDAWEGRVPDGVADHYRIANCRLTRMAKTHPHIRQVATPKAQVFTWENFLPAQACANVIALIETELRKSTTTDDFADPKIRTSSSSDIGRMGSALVMKIDEMMAEGLGIHWSYADITQAQRYEPTQEYKAHYDYFEPGTREYRVHCEERGQRTWTFMVYLNDVEEGGDTRFRRLEKSFRPRQGMAVIWNNLNPDGSVNPNTIHHGTKVREGRKYIITKWFRERGWGPMFLPER